MWVQLLAAFFWYTFIAAGSLVSGSSSYSSQQFSIIANHLWNLDKNRLVEGKDFSLNYQGNAPWRYNGRDYAAWPLFKSVNPEVFNRPTIKAFIALLDNYIHEVNVKEVNTQQEIVEVYQFLDEILRTPVMRAAHTFLRGNGKVGNSIGQFKSTLYTLWFQTYWRSGRNRIKDSSGFEHVFVGETRDYEHKVLGFHSWLRFYRLEKNNDINYLGFLKKSSANRNLMMMRFRWNSDLKAIGSSFVGTSPEFDIALYTIAYLMGYSDMPIDLAGVKMKVTCFGINRNRNIGTCYPDIV